MNDGKHISRKELDKIRSITPFRFLSVQGMQSLTSCAHTIAIPAGQTIIEQGQQDDKTCYIMLEGRVEVLDPQHASARIGFIDEGHYFGEWEAIFDVPRCYSIRTLTDCSCVLFNGSILQQFFDTERAFAQAFAAILRDRQGIFKGFELFRAEVMRGIGLGRIQLQDLLPMYETLNPALHKGALEHDQIDFSALNYAVRRLPSNVSSTFAFLIRDELPAVFEKPDELFQPIATDARHRSIWEILPGKDMVVIRSGMSDLMDFLTCMCIYAVEARKIRQRLYAEGVIKTLKDYLACRDDGCHDAAAEAQFIHSLGFSRADVSGFYRVWPKKTVEKLWDVLNHREMFSIDLRRQQNQYNLKSFNQWSLQISDACKKLLNSDPRELDPKLGIHIISSNTHSISNCLNPWFAANSQEILDWAQSIESNLLDEVWANRFDLVYALARDYFRQFPDKESEMLSWEVMYGIHRLSATPTTGIEAQLIDLDRTKGKAIDPGLPQEREGRNIILNIDFAFGEQAQDIIHQLILLFGNNIRSVNFLGKAGALCGKRGDILIPTAFIEQSHDAYLAIPSKALEHAQWMGQRNSAGEIFVGPMLTVQGTLLQNREMLNYYRNLWRVSGLEMEGFFYHRQVQEARETGLVRPDLESRFFYYVSDLPLDTGSNLSARLKASEGIPPLYAISREILHHILLVEK